MVPTAIVYRHILPFVPLHGLTPGLLRQMRRCLRVRAFLKRLGMHRQICDAVVNALMSDVSSREALYEDDEVFLTIDCRNLDYVIILRS